MKCQKLVRGYEKIKGKYPFLTQENFYRILLLYYGINYKLQNSFPNSFSHWEIIFSTRNLSSIPIITFLKPESPFQLIDSGLDSDKVLLYEGQFLDRVFNYEQRFFDMRKKEPFYFYVREINGNLVLKLNPVQRCIFYNSSDGNRPCQFCFRDDMVSRFRNITAQNLVSTIIKEEEKRDNYKLLGSIDELSIITGSYANSEKYLSEITLMIEGLKSYIPEDCRIVIGSHEAKTRKTFNFFKKIGVTTFSFPLESLDDRIRARVMHNGKGVLSEQILKNIEDAIEVFGDDGVIVRLIAGLGDRLDNSFKEKITTISKFDKKGKGPFWNINVFMPFTHYLWNKFSAKTPFTIGYLFAYCSLINQYIPQSRYYKFKISP